MYLNFLQGIGRQEGFYKDGTLAQRSNNPGNIEYGHFAAAYGGTKVGDDRFATFPTAMAGFRCLKALFQSPAYSNLTVEQALNRYAPNSENNTPRYIQDLCTWVGCKPTDKVGPLVDKCVIPDDDGEVQAPAPTQNVAKATAQQHVDLQHPAPGIAAV